MTASFPSQLVSVNHVRLFLQTIKFEHSVFALPFAILTAFQLEDGLPPAAPFTWVLVAMVGLRTFAMTANRLIDARIDSLNPRTADRAMPAGLITAKHMWLSMLISLGFYGAAVSQLDPLTWILAPIPVAVMTLYPYTKRFTWLSHFVLGLTYLFVPPATWIAFTGNLPIWTVIMGVAAALWVTGFDIIYGTQDVEVDVKQGLHSIPARFGVDRALMTARWLHIMAIVGLIVSGFLLLVGPLYWVGIGITAALLWYEHTLVSPRDLTKLTVAFFTMNGVIAVVFGVFTSLDGMLI